MKRMIEKYLIWCHRNDEKICLPDFLYNIELSILDMISMKFLSPIWKAIFSVVFYILCTSRRAVNFLKVKEKKGRKQFHYYWHDFEASAITKTTDEIWLSEKGIEQCQQHLIFLFHSNFHWIQWRYFFCFTCYVTK